jgi:hypothetical protein
VDVLLFCEYIIVIIKKVTRFFVMKQLLAVISMMLVLTGCSIYNWHDLQTNPDIPALFEVINTTDSYIELNWSTIENGESITILRSFNQSGPFETLADLSGDATSYRDSDLDGVPSAWYRLVSKNRYGVSPVTDPVPGELQTTMPGIEFDDKTVPGQVLVSLICKTESSQIYYTTDGSSPESDGVLYTAPFTVDGTADIRCVATHPLIARSRRSHAVFSFQTVRDPRVDDGYFSGRPVYYNQFDSEAQMVTPHTGSSFNGTWTYSEKGGYTSYSFPSYNFKGGLQVQCQSKKDNDYARVSLYPFNNSKPDLARGMVSYWGTARGGWRGKGDNTHIKAFHKFYLTGDTYVYIYGNADYDAFTYVFLYVDGVKRGEWIRNAGTMLPVTLQWDTSTETVDFYIDHYKLYSGSLTASASDINNYNQQFYLNVETTGSGDNRPSSDTCKAVLDNVIIWDEIINIDYIRDLEAYSN